MILRWQPDECIDTYLAPVVWRHLNLQCLRGNQQQTTIQPIGLPHWERLSQWGVSAPRYGGSSLVAQCYSCLLCREFCGELRQCNQKVITKCSLLIRAHSSPCDHNVAIRLEDCFGPIGFEDKIAYPYKKTCSDRTYGGPSNLCCL